MSNQELSAASKIVREMISGVDVFSKEEEKAALFDLVQLYVSDRIEYDRRVKELRSFFGEGVTLKAIEARVKQLIEAFSPKQLPQDETDVSDPLIRIAKTKAALWHDSSRVGFATFERDSHLEHHKVEGEDFKDFLSDKYGEKRQLVIDGKLEPIYPKRTDLTEAIFQIEAHARRGEAKKPGLRVMEWRGEVWIDGGAPTWSGYRISADGWKPESRLKAPLIRGDGMAPLPVPGRGGNISALEEFLNFSEREDFVLFCGDLAMTLNPFGNCLTTIMCGPPGSAKTTTVRVFRALTDPHEIDTRRVASVRDLMHGAANTHIIALENVSKISDELSDAICALNTRTGYAERKYYDQGVEFMVNVKRPVVINGIPGNLAELPDLVDRTITFDLDHLGERVRSDDQFWRRFNAVAPRLFGALLDGLVGAMRARRKFGDNNDELAAALLEGWRPRFVDAVVWAEAACQAMGFEPGEFAVAYRNNELRALRYIAEHDPICIGIRKLMAARGHWRGYPAELCADIRPYTQHVPSAVWLSRRLPWVIPILQKLYGIEVTMNRRLEQNDNRNGIVIESVGVGRGMYFPSQSVDPARSPAQVDEPAQIRPNFARRF
jgi:hypothetical protein